MLFDIPNLVIFRDGEQIAFDGLLAIRLPDVIKYVFAMGQKDPQKSNMFSSPGLSSE